MIQYFQTNFFFFVKMESFNFLTMTVHEDIGISTIVEKFTSIKKGKNLSENDVILWIDGDKDLPTFEKPSTARIVQKVTNPALR